MAAIVFYGCSFTGKTTLTQKLRTHATVVEFDEELLLHGVSSKAWRPKHQDHDLWLYAKGSFEAKARSGAYRFALGFWPIEGLFCVPLDVGIALERARQPGPVSEYGRRQGVIAYIQNQRRDLLPLLVGDERSPQVSISHMEGNK